MCEPGLINTLCNITRLLNALLPVLVALGVVYLVFGIVQYFIGDESEAKQKGKDRIVFGLIGLFVIISVWGLVRLIMTTLAINTTNATPTNNELKLLLPGAI